MRLYTRIILTVVGLLMLTTGALSTVLIYSARQDMIGTSKRDLEATTTLLAGIDSYLLSSTGQGITRNPVLQQLVDDLTGRGDIGLIHVVNEYHSTLATSSKPLSGCDRLLDDTDWNLIGRAQNDNKPQSELAGGILRAVAPVTDAEGKSRGAVFVRQTINRLDEATRNALMRGVALTGTTLALSVLASMALARSITRPVQRLSGAAQALARGEWQQKVQVFHLREIDALGQTFSSMAEQLREIYTSLEERVAERTAEVQKRADQVAAGAEVSHVASQELDPDRLLQTVADLIAERFKLYYAGIFVVDQAGQNAILRGASGPTGKAMLERGHQLKVGSASMVGWVCANKKARIALDVGEEPVRFANPLLPFTRSEMALPLRVADRLIGVLDIQSTQVQAFDADDITALQGMADQIAVALENARLFQQAQSSLKELERANRLLTQQGWQAFLHARATDYAEFHQAGLAPLTPEETDRLAVTDIDEARRIHIPLKLRGEAIGSLMVERTPDQPAWSAAERDVLDEVATQAAQAMDGVRLFEESQRRVAREQILGTIAARMRESLDVERVLQTAVREFGERLGVAEVKIRLTTDDGRTAASGQT